MKLLKNYLYILLFTAIYSCKVPYQPPLSNANTNYLVVDGTINNANGSTDSTFVKLSRTEKLTASDYNTPELHAQVSVEDGQGFTAALKETTNGNYVAGPLGLNNTKQYRLRIRTASGETYLSDLATPVYSPPIDSVGYTVNGDLVTIYANTHNPANNTRYYRWDYTETWEIIPAYISEYMSNGSAIVPRDAAHQYPTPCWPSDASASTILASTTNLVNDVVYQEPITHLTGTASQKLGIKYSMLLKQYGLTNAEYTFWSQLQKNTEDLGSIFDAQPSQINGNIHSTTNPAEPVFGYVGVTNVQTKRIFISRSDLSPFFEVGDSGCGIETAYFNPDQSIIPPELGVTQNLLPLPPTLIPLYQAYLNGMFIGYQSAVPICVDCSLTGTKIKPWFWVGS